VSVLIFYNNQNPKETETQISDHLKFI